MEVPPNLFETFFVMRSLWTDRQLERFITKYDEEPQRVSLSELRQKLGRGCSEAEVYRSRLVLVATCLFESGHQRTASDIIYEKVTDPENHYSLPPIRLELRRWTAEERSIANFLIQ
jgi:hypothetical protein